jgi:nucleotide-binding universal stress UspA family protein
MGRIVVGVDGSDGSRDALRWAAEQAALRGSTLEVVYTYEVEPATTTIAYDETMSPEVWQRAREDVVARDRQASDRAQALLASMVEGLDDVAVETLALEGRHPALTLVERSKGAELLVVGSRGRGGFKRLLLGSVSQQCAQHAECPVVIIRSVSDSPA